MNMEKKQGAEISFYAAECMEFAGHGELYENLSLTEAVDAYKKICKRSLNCGPGIGFILKDPETPAYSDIRWPLYQWEQIALDEIQLIPAYREHPLVKEAVREMGLHLPKIMRNGKKNRGMER